jgi:hypothetical protein
MDTDQVSALLDAMDAKHAELERAIGHLRALLAGHPSTDRPGQRTADEMKPGDWVRLPGSPRWRQVRQVTHCDLDLSECRRIDWDTYANDRDGTFVHVDPWTTYPWRSDREFQADCAREDDGLDRLHHAEWYADLRDATAHNYGQVADRA